MSRASLQAALPPGELLLIDTTVIVSYFKGTEATSPVAAYIIDQLVAAGRNPAAVSALTAMELLVPPIRDRDDTLYREVVFFLLNSFNLTVVSTDFSVAQQAARLRATYSFKSPDALIIGTGQAVNAQHFVTNDREWKRKLGAAHLVGITVCYLNDHLPFP